MPRAKGERRLEILKALAQMLEAPKWERITTAALAEKLDVSEAALYRHFASKAQMYEGLIEFIESSVFTLANRITEDEADGRRQAVTSDDVNAYLREASGRDITAKDFRTWGGTMLAAVELRAMGPAASRREADRNVLRAIDAVAERLGNTRAVCRKYYVHPALLHAYLLGRTVPHPPAASPRAKRRARAGGALRRDEVAVLQFLQVAIPEWTPRSSSPTSAPPSSR